MDNFWGSVGTIAGIVMPIWNIPLIVRIIQRKTSQDISLAWLFGVWSCIILMLPASMTSQDTSLKGFAISNTIFFSGVVLTVLWYRRPRK